MVRAVTPIPFVKARFFDRCGKPLTGGQIYTYEANTTTPKVTYKDPYGLTPNTNPIILDAAGEADIYLDGTYRIRITDRNDVLVNDVAKIGSWFSDNLQDTLDNISGAMDDAIKPALQSLDDAINAAAAAGAGANGWTDLLIATENGRTQRDKNNELKSIVDFGGVGDGVTNNTQAFINAFKATNNLLIPSGIWLVNTIEIPSDVTIVTHGFSTVIKHKAVDDEQRCIVVKGSNASIGDMTIIGNIATDKYEFHAAVEIHAKTNNIKNVTIGSIIAKDVRGDGLMIASNSGYLASDITVKSVYCDNVLRNGVSICGGNNIRIGSVSGKNVGFAILDLEPEPYNTPTTNVIVDYVQGRYVGVNSTSSDTYCDNVTIKNLELNGTLPSSNPVYQQGTTVVDAIGVRNTKNLIINNATISNYSRHAIFVIYNNGELGLKNLKIDNLTVSSCSLNDTTYNAYLNGANLASITVNKLIADLSSQQSKEILLSFKEAIINGAELKLGSNCNLLRNTPNSKLSNISNTSNLGCLVMGGSNNTSMTSCTGTYESITNYSDKCTIINSTLTATSYIADSNNQNHIVINSTLNGKYYTYGTLKDGYQSAILLGGTYLWFDNTGTMRYKYGQPTSDTDGTAVAKVK